MHWILQSNFIHEEKYEEMVQTLVRFGIPYSVHKVVPFVGELEPAPALSTTNVICVGSYSMRHAAKQNAWTPGVFDLFDQNFNIQMRHWGRHMLNADSIVSMFKDAVLTEELMFIRPIDDAKYFAGRLFERDEFVDWQTKVCALGEDYGTSLSGDTYIQLSTPKRIYREVRYWIVRDQVITASVYKLGDRVTYAEKLPDAMDAFVAALIDPTATDYWQPAEAFVLDICELPDETYKIVEINTLNSSGFYAADIAKLTLVLEEAFTTKD